MRLARYSAALIASLLPLAVGHAQECVYPDTYEVQELRYRVNNPVFDWAETPQQALQDFVDYCNTQAPGPCFGLCTARTVAYYDWIEHTEYRNVLADHRFRWGCWVGTNLSQSTISVFSVSNQTITKDCPPEEEPSAAVLVAPDSSFAPLHVTVLSFLVLGALCGYLVIRRL